MKRPMFLLLKNVERKMLKVVVLDPPLFPRATEDPLSIRELSAAHCDATVPCFLWLFVSRAFVSVLHR